MSTDTDHGPRDLVFRRTLAAPRALVWEAWTNPAHLARWWGPMGFTVTTESAAVKAGGEWRFLLHGPDGTDYTNHIVYDEVVEGERLVYRHVPEPDAELVNFETTVTLADAEGGTALTMRMRFETAEMLRYVAETYGAVEGAHHTLGRLERHLAGTDTDEQFVVSRTALASRAAVFQALADALHQRSAPPVLHEILPPERIVCTLSLEWPAGPRDVLATFTVNDEGDGVVVTMIAAPVGATAAERRFFRDEFRAMQLQFGAWLDTLADP